MMIVILSIWIFSNTESLLMLPLTTPDQFLSGMPYVTFSIPGKDVILIQPFSTILVYLLGLIMIAIGVYFLVTKKPAVMLLLGYRINRRGASVQLSLERVIRLSVTN
jgi:hypothetical protein